MKLDKQKFMIAMYRKGWSQNDLAEAVGCTKQTISFAVRGRNLTAKLAFRIANALGVDVVDILKLDEEA